MIESQNSEVDLIRLKERISQDLKRGRLDDPGFSLSLDDSDLTAAIDRPSLPSLPPYAPAELQREISPNGATSYSVHELMAFRGAAFVRVAFAAILGREPDPAGFAHYLTQLHQGRAKAEILSEIRNSDEGRARGIEVRGLKARSLLARAFRVPVLGRAAEFALSVAQLPSAQRNRRQFEDEMMGAIAQVQENARVQSERLRVALETLAVSQESAFEHFDRRLVRQRTRMELMRGAVSAGRVRLATLERELAAQEEALSAAQKQIAAASSSADSHALDSFYAEFESRFRGPRDRIKERQSVYLSLLTHAKAGSAAAPVLDLGCGRGEWLELLAENGFVARGADLNRVFIKDNRARGFDIVEQDALSCLRSLKPNSLGAVTAFHLIEHLPFKVLVTLVDEALRVLKPGGVLVFETPNPANHQVGANNFYLDPTHLHPIPSGLAVALLELRGFKHVSIKELHPYPEASDGTVRDAAVSRFFFGPQDYGVIGWKAT